MIPAPIRKEIGEEILQVAISARLTGDTKEAKMRQLVTALVPYFRRPSEHTLSAMYVSALFKLRAAHMTYNRKAIHLRDHMRALGCPFRLTDDEWTNFAKLRPWGLIAHGDPTNPRSGTWLLTPKGADFLKGNLSIPKKVYTFRGKVYHPKEPLFDEKLVNIQHYKDELPEFETYFDFVPPRVEPRPTATLPIFGK